MPSDWNGVERRRGRPPLVPGERSLTFNVRLPESQYDQVAVHCVRTGVSMPSVIRRALALLIETERAGVSVAYK